MSLNTAVAAEIQCVDCGQTFELTEGEKEFFESKGFSLPKRCKPCRVEKKKKNFSRDRQ